MDQNLGLLFFILEKFIVWVNLNIFMNKVL